MEILIPGALPPATVAPELIQYVERSCPALIDRLKRIPAQIIRLAPDEIGCTPFEAVELLRKGYVAPATANLGAGLGPLRAGVTQPNEKVWVAELSSVTVGTNGAALVDPRGLDIMQTEADDLFEAVCSLWVDSPISILPISPTRWRVWLSREPEINSISPSAMTGMAMADWWPQHESARSWRKLLNEIQMLWHEHPVNLARAERGAPPINSLWLYGGAHGWTVERNLPAPIIYEGLSRSHAQGDWANWIETLPALSAYLSEQPADARLTLVGPQHIIELRPVMPSWWRRLLPARPQHWKTWWNLPN